jgi:hypothetical protein
LAYFNDPQDDENQQANPNAPAPIGPQGSGTIQGGGSAPGGAQAPASPKAPDHASNFVGISQYLNANKPQAQKLGDQASGVITNSANDARTSVNDLNNTFNQKAGSATSIDPNILGKVNQAETLGEPEKQQIKTAYSAQYQGPNSLTDLGDQYNIAGKKLNTAKQNVEAAGTEGGRQNLITQINEKPRTQGVTNFDSVLLQAGGGREKLNQAATANKDVSQDLLAQGNVAATQKAADIKSQTDATRTATQNAVGGAQTSLGDSISQRLKEMQTGLTARNNQITQDLGNDAYSLDADTLNDFGLTEGQRSYGLNPMDYWHQGDISQINNANVANQDEYARAAALADLSGGQSLLNPNDVSQAGTAAQYMSGKIDKDKLLGDLGAKDTDYNKKSALSVKDMNDKLNGGNIMYNPDFTLDQLINNAPSKNGGWYVPPQVQAAMPKGSIQNASPKEIQEKWLPWVNSWTKADPGPDGSTARNLKAYLEKQTDPFKVTAANTFKKNK